MYSKNKAWKKKKKKKNQAWTGFEPMTSAIPVQRSHQLSYQANWELVTLWVCYIPEYMWCEYVKFHIFELQTNILSKWKTIAVKLSLV